jgi:hypothetical protein
LISPKGGLPTFSATALRDAAEKRRLLRYHEVSGSERLKARTNQHPGLREQASEGRHGRSC